jgi:hypothetical protein
MRKIKLPWYKMYCYVKTYTIQGIIRMGLTYQKTIDGRLNKDRPITIIDHLIYTNVGIQKEGVQINLDGNPHNLDFDYEIVYLSN